MKTTVILETNRSGMYIRRNLHDTFHELTSDFNHLRSLLEYGKVLVENKHLGERWQEISGPEEIIDKLFAEPTIQEQIDAIKQEIEQYERTLAGMSRYDGSRSSIENGELPRLKAKLQELLAQQGTKFLKEEVQTLLNQIDVRINGNTVKKIEVDPEPEPEVVTEIVEDVDEFEVKATCYENDLGKFIKFESSEGNALRSITQDSWACIQDELPLIWKEKIMKKFQADLDRLQPQPVPTSTCRQTLDRQAESPQLEMDKLQEIVNANNVIWFGFPDYQNCHPVFLGEFSFPNKGMTVKLWADATRWIPDEKKIQVENFVYRFYSRYQILNNGQVITDQRGLDNTQSVGDVLRLAYRWLVENEH